MPYAQKEPIRKAIDAMSGSGEEGPGMTQEILRLAHSLIPPSDQSYSGKDVVGLISFFQGIPPEYTTVIGDELIGIVRPLCDRPGIGLSQKTKILYAVSSVSDVNRPALIARVNQKVTARTQARAFVRAIEDCAKEIRAQEEEPPITLVYLRASPQ